jgi:hypothetical protein
MQCKKLPIEQHDFEAELFFNRYEYEWNQQNHPPLRMNNNVPNNWGQAVQEGTVEQENVWSG